MNIKPLSNFDIVKSTNNHLLLYIKNPNNSIKNIIQLNSGYDDERTIMKDSDGNIFVLSRNTQLDYIGLEIFNKYGYSSGEAYFDNSEALPFLNMSRKKAIIALAEYTY